jgi:Leucine Rich repeat
MNEEWKSTEVPMTELPVVEFDQELCAAIASNRQDITNVDISIDNNPNAFLLGASLEGNTHIKKFHLHLGGSAGASGARSITKGLSQSCVTHIYFTFYNQFVGIAFFHDMGDVPNLKVLEMVNFSPSSVSQHFEVHHVLSHLKKLVKLSITGMPNLKTLEGLSQCLVHTPPDPKSTTAVLRHLKLSGTTLSSEDMLRLCRDGLRHNRSLRFLDLMKCSISNASIEVFCQHLPSFSSQLIGLNLKGNFLCPRGATLLVSTIRAYIPGMLCLNLSSNLNIDYQGMSQIAQQLPRSMIQKIFLRDCIRHREEQCFALEETLEEDTKKRADEDAADDPHEFVTRFEYCPLRMAARYVRRRLNPETGKVDPSLPPVVIERTNTLYLATQAAVDAATQHQEALLKEVETAKIGAMDSLLHLAKTNPNLHRLDITDNGFGAAFEDQVDYYTSRNRLHSLIGDPNVNPITWSYIFERSTHSTLYSLLLDNPALLRHA